MKSQILIVDDEPDITQLIQQTLEREGFDCSTAQTGIQALQQFKQIQPDVVILDWMLPELDGLEVCTRIRQQASPKDPYILMLTCLLYTSPSPRDLSTSRMPSSA